MGKSSLTKNYLYNVAYKILTMITPLITTPYISRVLGVENVGIFNYTYSVLSYFLLFAVLGFQMYGQREIAYVSQDKVQRNEKFWEIFLSRLITVFIVTIAYIIYIGNSNYFIIYSLFFLELIAQAIDISWFYYGVEEFKTITIRNFIIKIVGVLCIFCFVKTSNDLSVYVFLHAFVILCGNLCLWPNVLRKNRIIKINYVNCFNHFKFAFLFFIPQCIDSVYMLMDKIMLGNFSTMAEVGLYGQADKIVKMIVTIITSMGLVVSPRIAQCYAENKKNELKKYMNQSINFVFILGFPMTFGLISISSNFSSWFFGSGYDGVDSIMSCLTPIIILMGLNSVMGWQYLMTVKKERTFIVSVTIGAIVNLFLNILLINKFNAMGAVIASVLSMCVMTIKNFISVREVIDFKKIMIDSYKSLISSIIMFVCISLISNCFSYGIISTVIISSIGLGVFFVSEFILKDMLVVNYIKKNFNKLRV